MSQRLSEIMAFDDHTCAVIIRAQQTNFNSIFHLFYRPLSASARLCTFVCLMALIVPFHPPIFYRWKLSAYFNQSSDSGSSICCSLRGETVCYSMTYFSSSVGCHRSRITLNEIFQKSVAELCIKSCFWIWAAQAPVAKLAPPINISVCTELAKGIDVYFLIDFVNKRRAFAKLGASQRELVQRA